MKGLVESVLAAFILLIMGAIVFSGKNNTASTQQPSVSPASTYTTSSPATQPLVSPEVTLEMSPVPTPTLMQPVAPTQTGELRELIAFYNVGDPNIPEEQRQIKNDRDWALFEDPATGAREWAFCNDPLAKDPDLTNENHKVFKKTGSLYVLTFQGATFIDQKISLNLEGQVQTFQGVGQSTATPLPVYPTLSLIGTPIPTSTFSGTPDAQGIMRTPEPRQGNFITRNFRSIATLAFIALLVTGVLLWIRRRR